MYASRSDDKTNFSILIPCVAMLAALIGAFTWQSRLKPYGPFGDSPTATISIEHVPIHRGPVETRSLHRRMFGDEIPPEVLVLMYPKPDNGWHIVEAGNRAFDNGHVELALSRWLQVMNEHESRQASFAARYNSGLVEMHRRQFQQSIAHFESILNFANDPLKVPSIPRNDTYYACCHLSACYHSLGDDANALKYAEQAQKKYPLSDFCGVWLDSEQKLLDDHIEMLKRSWPPTDTMR